MTTADLAARAAASAFPAVSAAPRSERAAWLTALADALEADRDELVALAHRETHLSVARLDGEVTRTANQLRFFAGALRDGGYLEASVDSADPSTVPPRPDLRRMLRPIGPVAVFGASNFPFAFSVLGNDTASALAAGCPVVVKAHPGHPELSRRVAELAVRALREAGAPDGTFALVEGMDEGIALVAHPAIRAVGFTGSLRGGRALFDIANGRPDPIPFYGELGSMNPVVVTPGAVDRIDELALGLVASFTRDGGQYCTKPGIVFAPAGAGLPEAVRALAAAVEPHRLLTPGMEAAFASRTNSIADGAVTADGVAPVVVATTVDELAADRERYLEECFGPHTVVVEYADRDELHRALALLPGSLTASVHHAPREDVGEFVTALAPRAGRIIFNGWPTGVAIAWSQHHGGPWPATTGSIHTSVGATAIRRFLAPIAYQDAPAEVLPEELRDGNPLGIPRREDGVLKA